MKCRKTIRWIVLGILTSVSSLSFASVNTDSLVMQRVFNYQRDYTSQDVRGFTTNVYVKHNINIWKRNASLWLIPNMYPIADGSRQHVSESYNKLTFDGVSHYDAKRQVLFSTVRHNRYPMSTLADFLTPSLYAVTIFNGYMLSPFHRANRHFYKYQVQAVLGKAYVFFKPRLVDNTQLISGSALVDMATGRIISTTLRGEYDMIRFHTEMVQGQVGMRSLIPKTCKSNVEFKFAGNHIYASIEGVYDCPVSLPDTVVNVDSRQLMDSLRPIPLTEQERYVYRQHEETHATATAAVDEQTDSLAADSMATAQRPKADFLNDVLRHAIGDNLVLSHRYRTDKTYLKVSPILNPQYISYSHSKGTAYKIKLGADYYFNDHRYFEFDPWFGYNFKFRKFYFTIPLRFTYNPKRDGYVEVVYGNGNRTSHNSVITQIQQEHGDTLNLDGQDLDLFDDNHLTITNNIMAFDWLDVEAGFTMHRRHAYEPGRMHHFGKPADYHSFAPMLAFKVKPWRTGPLFTLDYERGIKALGLSDIAYERWELDGSLKHELHALRKLNLRLGAGLYTRRDGITFVDFTHFRDHNLPGGWDDDWSGNFQLLRSRWYNDSRYYARANFSYDSPLLCLSWLPAVGRYIESERFYLSALSIDHTRPYWEAGYGFTNRFFSIGLFGSFLNTHFQDFECKFTFELFRRW